MIRNSLEFGEFSANVRCSECSVVQVTKSDPYAGNFEPYPKFSTKILRLLILYELHVSNICMSCECPVINWWLDGIMKYLCTWEKLSQSMTS